MSFNQSLRLAEILIALVASITAAEASNLPADSLLKENLIVYRCSNGLGFSLYPGQTPAGNRTRLQGLPVVIKINQTTAALKTELYAYNIVLREPASNGIRVWFNGKTGEVSVVRGDGADERMLGRHCRNTL